MFGLARKSPDEQPDPVPALTPSQARLQEKLGARVGEGDGCSQGEIYLYSRGPDGTTRILVGPDGTVLEHTAWERDRRK